MAPAAIQGGILPASDAIGVLDVMVPSLTEALEAARTAQSQGLALHLRSPEGAAAAQGFGWFASLVEAVAERHPALDIRATLDCADLTASAIGAMRRGIRHIRFSGSAAAFDRLSAIAAEFGAEVEHAPRPAFL